MCVSQAESRGEAAKELETNLNDKQLFLFSDVTDKSNFNQQYIQGIRHAHIAT